MNVKVTLDQLYRISMKNQKTRFAISELQLTKIQNILSEGEPVMGLHNDVVDENTDQVTLKNLDEPTGTGIIVITKKTNDPNEPTLKSLIGKRKWNVVPIEKDGQTIDYTIVNISSYITKEHHENFDNVTSVNDLIIKLKNDPFFKNMDTTVSRSDFKMLEELKNKGEKIDRITVQIYYLLYRRSGTLKKFITKLNLFLPFMRMLLRKGDPMFTCIMEKLEKALGDMDDSLLRSFSEKKENFERLFNFLKGLKQCDEDLSIDIFSFFKTAEYLKYEKEFVGTHFKHSPTSVSIDLTMKESLSGLDHSEFNQMINLDKMNSILKWVVSNHKNGDKNYEQLFEEIVDNLSIKFPDLIKKDLDVVSPIYQQNSNENLNPLLNIGDFVEVKYKSFDKPDFLCEFFKPESHNATMEYLVSELMNIDDSINSSNEVLRLISILDTTIVEKIKSSGIGQVVIDAIKENTSGIIFKDYVYVKMQDIDLEWTNVGYAGKPRIAIKYSVKEDTKKYKLNIDNKDRNQINTIFWTE